MSEKLFPFPIDNKNVLEDFADELHGSNCVERRKNGFVRQAFYEEDVLWELIYQFGDNWFQIIRRSERFNTDCSVENLKQKVLALADEENGLYVKIRKADYNVIKAEFLKAEW